MAILWADGFDHYGTSPNGGRTKMLAGAWAAISYNTTGSDISVSSAQPRTGTYALRINHGANAVSQARRVVGSARTVVGCGFGARLNSLPIANDQHGFEIRNASNEPIVRVVYQSDGSLGVKITNALTSLGNTDPVLVAGAYNHIEIKTTIDDIVGDVTINVNGAQVFLATDLNLGVAGASQYVWGSLVVGADDLITDIDDIVTWDDDGAVNNDFLGQQRVHTIFPTADTAVADWAAVGAVDDFDCVDEVPPDDDATYLAATVVAEVTELGIDSLPPETETIAGVYIPTLGRLAEAGLGNVRTSMVSGVAASDGPSQAFSASYAYYGVAHQVDPNTGVAWTKVGLEAALVRITKTV